MTRKVVIVTSCQEVLISNRSARPTPAETAEERRLFYVALMWCKEVLVLSSFSLIPRKEAYTIGMEGRLFPERARKVGSSRAPS